MNEPTRTTQFVHTHVRVCEGSLSTVMVIYNNTNIMVIYSALVRSHQSTYEGSLLFEGKHFAHVSIPCRPPPCYPASSC